MDLNQQISKARELKNMLRAFADAEEVLQAAAAVQGNLGDLKAQRKGLQDDIDSLRKAREAAQAEIAGFDREREDAVRGAADARAALRQAESDAVQRKNQIEVEVGEFKRKAEESMDAHLAVLTKAHEANVAKMADEIAGLGAKRDSLQSEIDAIKKKLG
jgi:chromosome segregation ATPase